MFRRDMKATVAAKTDESAGSRILIRMIARVSWLAGGFTCLPAAYL